MAFNPSNFSMRGYLYNAQVDAQFTHIGEWDYSTSDDFTTISASGYFNPVADKIRPGDFIHVDSSSDGDIILLVTNVSNPAGLSGTQMARFY